MHVCDTHVLACSDAGGAAAVRGPQWAASALLRLAAYPTGLHVHGADRRHAAVDCVPVLPGAQVIERVYDFGGC